MEGRARQGVGAVTGGVAGEGATMPSARRPPASCNNAQPAAASLSTVPSWQLNRSLRLEPIELQAR